jgi:hypothetical protein
MDEDRNVRRGRRLARQQTVGAVWVPEEVCGVAARIVVTMLGQEDLIGMVGPTGTGSADIGWAEALS